MFKYPQLINRISLAVTTSLLLYSIFWWSVGFPKAYFDLSECLAALKLVFCGVILAIIGGAVGRLCSNRKVNLPISNLPFISKAILALAIGELSAMAWVYARSALSGLFYLLFRLQIPISSIEVVILVLLAVFVLLRQRDFALTVGALRIWESFGFLLILLFLFAPIAFRELPRDIPLSSDPDQHAFWASQVVKLGIVPWDQGLTGVGPFGYPAGFAVMNAVWMVFSGFSAVQIVTLQPALQFLLSVAVLGAVGPLMVRCIKISFGSSKGCDLGRIGGFTPFELILFGVALYWFFFPFGLKIGRFFGEGTARLSLSLLYLALVITMVAMFLKMIPRSQSLIAISLATALIVTVNAISGLIPLGLFLLLYIAFCLQSIRLVSTRRRAQIERFGFILAPLLILLILSGEPYIVFNFLGAIFKGSTPDSSNIPVYLIKPYLTESYLHLLLVTKMVVIACLLSLYLSLPYLATKTLTILALCIVNFIPKEPLSVSSQAFNLHPRSCSSSTPHCLTLGEKNALYFVQNLGNDIIDRYPSLSYTLSPKILMLGVPATRGVENWVFPSDAARVLPLYSPIPVAFFYGRGHSDWSFANYRNRVCKRLDINWLSKRNVRYLFLSSREHGCLFNRREVIRRSRILFEEDRARVLELF